MITVATGKPILDLEVSFLMFRDNYRLLLQSSRPSAQLVDTEWAIDPRRVERRALGIARDFYNFVATLKMLVDHYRANKHRGIYGESLAQALDAEIARLFRGDALTGIFGKLRNLYSHAEIPVMGLVAGHPSYRTVLDIDYLRTDRLETNTQEAAFLASLQSRIEVHELVTPYFEKAQALYLWTQRAYARFNPESAGDLALLLEPLEPHPA